MVFLCLHHESPNQVYAEVIVMFIPGTQSCRAVAQVRLLLAAHARPARNALQHLNPALLLYFTHPAQRTRVSSVRQTRKRRLTSGIP